MQSEEPGYSKKNLSALQKTDKTVLCVGWRLAQMQRVLQHATMPKRGARRVYARRAQVKFAWITIQLKYLLDIDMISMDTHKFENMSWTFPFLADLVRMIGMINKHLWKNNQQNEIVCFHKVPKTMCMTQTQPYQPPQKTNITLLRIPDHTLFWQFKSPQWSSMHASCRDGLCVPVFAPFKPNISNPLTVAPPAALLFWRWQQDAHEMVDQEMANIAWQLILSP